MRKTKLPTAYKGGTKCKNCKALIMNSYDYFNGVYCYRCSGCGATRYEPSAKFAIKFSTADQITK